MDTSLRFSEIIDRLAAICSQISEDGSPEQDLQTEARLIFMEFYQLQRSTINSTLSQSAIVASEREKNEDLHLKLENYQFELSHVRKEIESCKSYEPVYVDIEFQDEDERFRSDDGQEMLESKLKAQLKKRIDMKKNLHELKARKSALNEDNRLKCARLSELAREAEDIIKLQIQIQQKLEGLSTQIAETD